MTLRNLTHADLPPGVTLRRVPMKRKRAKTRSKAMQSHMDRVAEMGCIACALSGNPGTPAELHHPRTDAGGGQKAPDSDVIPLCPAHHRGTLHPKVPSIHRDRSAFIETFGSEADLLAWVRNVQGKLA
jgi:hypothetical protein